MDTRSVIVNLGCGDTPLVGALNTDHRRGPGVDVVLETYALPFRDNCLAAVHASHVLEHVQDFVAALDELYRVLEPGGTLVASVPYGLEGLLNPLHQHAFDEFSLGFFTRKVRDLDAQATRWRMRNIHTRKVPQPLSYLTGILVGKERELFFTLEAVKD